jgi:uncharacterized protein (TIGR03083 family)
MSWLEDDHYGAALRGFSARLADLVADDQRRPVPTCPGWTFRELTIHVGRAQRWGAHLVATGSTQMIPSEQAPDGKPPATPAERAAWLRAGPDRLISAVAAAPEEPVWTMAGIRPARFWLRRLTHEGSVHLADAQLAAGQPAALPADVAADGIDEWLTAYWHGAGDDEISARAQRPGPGPRRAGQTLSVRVTDPGVSGEWLVRLDPERVTVTAGQAPADATLSGPAASLLLVLTRRLPPSAVSASGDHDLLAGWLDHMRF